MHTLLFLSKANKIKAYVQIVIETRLGKSLQTFLAYLNLYMALVFEKHFLRLHFQDTLPHPANF